MQKDTVVAEIRSLNLIQRDPFKYLVTTVSYAVSISVLIGCSVGTDVNSRASFDSEIIGNESIVRENSTDANLTVVSTSQLESADEIQAYPTSLRYDSSDKIGNDFKTAWERCTLFFKLYLKDNLQIKIKGNQTQMQSHSSKLLYKVESTKGSSSNGESGTRIVVNVTDLSGKSNIDSDLASRNLARFIDKGELLVELVK